MKKTFTKLKWFHLTLFGTSLMCTVALYQSYISSSQNRLTIQDQVAIYGEKSLEEIENMPKYDRPDLAIMQNFDMTKDPALNDVPTNRSLEAFETIKQKSFAQRAIQGVNWQERGPNNVAGRTRALMFDPNDATNSKVWAGSVGGGLWFNNNITSSSSQWQNVNDFWANLALTSIAYDPSNTQTFYVSTGEGFFNADAIRGAGIWKSTNGGTSWSQLSSTDNSNFYYVQKVAVTSSGTVLATTHTGLYRSTNGGSSWTQILSGGRFADLEVASNGDIYVSRGIFQAGVVFKSTNDGASFSDVTPATGGQRIELAVAPSNSSTVYAIASDGNTNNIAWFRKSTNGGSSWSTVTVPKYVEQGTCNAGTQDFTRGQSWYDLILSVSPTNPNLVLAGGIDIHRSTNGGSSWSSVSYWTPNCSRPNVHADQHSMAFRPGSPNTAIFGNDGGVYYSSNVGNSSATPTFGARNTGYNVTQFYAADQVNTSGSNTLLAGAQDNGSHRFTNAGINSTTEVSGGDGAFCHIDQDNSTYQITSYVFNSFYRSTNGGSSFSQILSNQTYGRFINPTEYDDAANTLYSAANEDGYIRLSGITGTVDAQLLSVSLGGFRASALKVSPYTANRLYIGTGTNAGSGGSKVFRIDNANGSSPTSTEVSTASIPSNGYISSIDVGSSDNQLIVTLSNYGIVSVWETRNGGSSWVNREGNLPDIPIRWALYNPSNTDEVLLATELGVWSTENVNVANPDWGVTNTGLANVRTDMLQYRASDGQVVVATHGRGAYTAQPFSANTGDTQAPSTPTNLTTSNVTSSSFDASWTASTDNVGVTNYTVSLNGAVSGTTASTNYSFTGLTASTSYTVTVVANDAAGNNSGNASANVTTSSTNQACTGGITTFPYSEGFESGIGAWTQATGDDGNWLSLSGSTPSSSTGPTSASEGSNYLYLEASTSGAGQIGSNATANLESPCFDLSSESSADFNFKYHMWGGNMGTLRVEASTNGGSTYTEIWSRAGDQGNAWLSETVSLNAYIGGTVSLRFRGTTGGGWQSDIAIDDLEVVGGTTADTQAPTAPTSLAASNVAETSLTLSWTASTDNVGVTGYDVYQGASNIGTVAGTSSNVTGLTANTAYTFTVIAKDAAGNESSASNAVNVTTLNSSSGCTGGISSFPYSEGLESGSGGWTQGTGDDGNWLNLSGSTPSSSTGPTSSSQGSNYLYLEASTSGAGQIGSNATAILESPCINLSSLSTANFNFKYHMWGGNMGTLRVEASTDGTTYTEIWSRTGDQGNSWLTGTVSLASYIGGNVNIRFRGTTGNGWQSDIAIDDISITSGSVSTIPCSLTISSFPYSESFESGAGSFVQATGDDGDWVNDASGTPSNGTGPSSATDGSFYMFLEASSNSSVGQIGSNATAILESPCFDLTGQSIANFNFSYHMLGSNMGSLVLEATTDGTTWTNIWSRSGDQGSTWLNASVSLNAYLGSTVKLRFNGTTGSSWQSDMAIDNVSLTSTATTSAISSNPISDLIVEKELAELQMFPNPMTNVLNIKMNGLSGQYAIISLSGKTLRSGNFSNEETIDVSGLIPGYYLVRVGDGENTFIEKVLKR